MNKRNALLGVVVLTLLVAVTVWLVGQWSPSSEVSTSPDGYEVWTADYLKAQMATKNFALINVHVPDEGDIPGTDRKIPYTELVKDPSLLKLDKDSPVVIYCMSGRMSEIAARALVQNGYSRVIILEGGMLAWEEAGYPLER